MTEIVVTCGVVVVGWHCQVRVADQAGASDHKVDVGEIGSLLPSVLSDPAVSDVERLVRETFAFLLEREPRTSILREFDLNEVSRYFPEYPTVIRVRLSR